MTEKPSVESNPEQSPGAYLKTCREKSGQSLEAVHEATKIPLDILRAIEEGYTVRTLTTFYYKGFLKIYAQHLNVDIQDVVSDYKKETLPQHIPSVRAEEFVIKEFLDKNLTPSRKIWIVKFLVVCLCAFLALKIFGAMSRWMTERKKATQLKSTPAQVKTAKPPAPRPAPSVKDTKNIEKKELAAPPVSPAVQTVVPPVDLPTPQETQPVMTKNVQLTLRARRDSWLIIKADGQVVFQATLKTGSVESWNADHQIEISGKNISQLEFEVNGKMIGTLGRDDRRAKKVVVTKDGLQVSK